MVKTHYSTQKETGSELACLSRNSRSIGTLDNGTAFLTPGIRFQIATACREARLNLVRFSVYFFTSGATVVGTTPDKASFTETGSLSALAHNKLTCHICVVESVFSNPGIPVIRMPPATFQYDSPGGSSVTPVPSINLGGLGNIPLAMADCSAPGKPWHTAQCSL